MLLLLNRYLAVRLGLSVAVVKDVFGQQERQAVDRLQPQSLAQHYKSGASARLSLSDIRPEDLDVVRNALPSPLLIVLYVRCCTL